MTDQPHRAPRLAEARVPVTARVSKSTATKLRASAAKKGVSVSALAASIIEEVYP